MRGGTGENARDGKKLKAMDSVLISILSANNAERREAESYYARSQESDPAGVSFTSVICADAC